GRTTSLVAGKSVAFSLLAPAWRSAPQPVHSRWASTSTARRRLALVTWLLSRLGFTMLRGTRSSSSTTRQLCSIHKTRRQVCFDTHVTEKSVAVTFYADRASGT